MANEFEVDSFVKDKNGKTVAVGDAVSVGGRPAKVLQIAWAHPQPSPEVINTLKATNAAAFDALMEHADFRALVKVDGEDDERRVSVKELEKA